jgi:hypothetical protein
VGGDFSVVNININYDTWTQKASRFRFMLMLGLRIVRINTAFFSSITAIYLYEG